MLHVAELSVVSAHGCSLRSHQPQLQSFRLAPRRWPPGPAGLLLPVASMAGELEDHPGAANGHATDEEERKSRKLPAPCLLPRPHSEAFEDEEAQQQVDGAPLLGGARELVTAAKDLAASSSTRARELSASVAQTTKTISLSTWAIFLRDWGESYEASFDLITLWLCPSCFRLLDEKEQHRHWSILWNPVFWAMHLPLVFCILSGKWLHTLWGQGDKVREDENMEENRVRTHWIYCLDGPIAGLCILDLLDAVLDVPMYSQRKFQVRRQTRREREGRLRSCCAPAALLLRPPTPRGRNLLTQAVPLARPLGRTRSSPDCS